MFLYSGPCRCTMFALIFSLEIFNLENTASASKVGVEAVLYLNVESSFGVEIDLS